jgi:hypothetical protein
MLAASAGVHLFHHSHITYYVSFMGANMIVINEPSENKNNKCYYMCYVCIFNNFKLIFQLYKQVDGHEISWALGAAFHILQNGL